MEQSDVSRPLFNGQRTFVSLPLYGDDPKSRFLAAASTVEAAKDAAPDTRASILGTKLMDGVHWPDFCVSCGDPRPSGTYEITHLDSSLVHTRRGIPICARCLELQKKENLTNYLAPVGVFGVIGIIWAACYWGSAAVARILSTWFTSTVVPTWVGGIVVFVTSTLVILFSSVFIIDWAMRRWTRYRQRQFPGWETVPTTDAVRFDSSGLKFDNGAYAEEFARANGRAAKPCLTDASAVS